MLQSLWEMRDQVLEFVKEIQVVAAVLTGFGLSALWIIVRQVSALLDKIKYQCSTSLIFSSGSIDGGRYNEQQFNAFLEWFGSTKYFTRLSRSITFLKSPKTYETIIGPGLGTHYIMYKGRFGYFNLSLADTPGTMSPRYSVTLTLYTRKHTLLQDLVDEFIFVRDHNDVKDPVFIMTFQSNDGGDGRWTIAGDLYPRTLESVIIAEDIKTELISKIDEFIAGEEWYKERGINYKLVILLYGKPGTGKSSLIRALATRYQRHLSILSLSGLNADSLTLALAKSRNSFVVMEDVDTYNVINTRVKKKKVEREENEIHTSTGTYTSLALTDVLNALDGVSSSNGSITILTANHTGHIDAALTRKGRVDYALEIPYLTDAEIRTYFKTVYKQEMTIPAGMTYIPLPGCDIQDIFLSNVDSPEDFLKELNAKYLIPISTGENYVKTSNAGTFEIPSSPTQ